MYKKLFISILIFNFLKISAQLCGGSFGAPIFNETFGAVNTTNQTISPALVAPAFTTYNYSPTFPPNDGSYTISNSTEYLTWGWQKSFDHTTNNGYGNMLVVNADYTPKEFYRRRVSNLCPNQIYRFSAWVLNIHRAGANLIKPNVTFKILTTSGNLIGQVDTGDIPESSTQTWTQFYLDFNSDPTSTSVDVVLINNAPGGMGNDLAIDDISFSPCGPTTAVNTNISSIFSSGVCDNSQNLQLTAQLLPNTFQNANFIWQKSSDGGITWANVTTASTNPVLNILAGTYQNNDGYRFIVGEGNNVNSPNCQVISSPNFVKVIGYPNAPPSQIFNFCQNSSANISLNLSNLLWYTSATGGIGSATTPTVDTSVVGTNNYWITQTQNGCESQRSQITVNVGAKPSAPKVYDINYCQDEVANPLNATGTNLLWYTSATGGTGNSVAPTPNTTVSGTTSYFVTQSNNGCESDRVELKVTVLPKPKITTLENKSICDGGFVTLDAGSGFEKYEWNTVPPENSQIITVTKPGDYSVTVTDKNGCKNTQTVTVNAGSKPTITEIISGENFLEVKVSGGNPPYLYSLDGQNWQTSNIFNNLKPAVYTVFVKSNSLACIASLQSAVLFIPNTFTPNNDAYNNTWKIKYIEFFPEAKLKIYDRYGKLVYSAEKIADLEWNGILNGRILPTGSYWYVLKINDSLDKTGWIYLRNL